MKWAFFIKHQYLIGLSLIIVLLVIYKLPALSLPYFWDEAWPYGVAVHMLYDHGLSFMPNAIPAEISRGHPLMFHFLSVVWMKIFGTGQVSGHSFALFVSVLTVVSVYLFGRRFFSERVGFIAALLFSCQPVFISQAVFLMPEMLMALWTILAFYCYFANKKIWFIIVASAMLLTKESGAVLILVLGIYEVLALIIGKRPMTKQAVGQIALIAAPVFIAGIYFVIQKIVYGWFLFPFYMDYIASKWTAFKENLPSSAAYMFIYYGRNGLTVFAILSFVTTRYIRKEKYNEVEKKILSVFGWYIIGYLLFSSINYYIPRYLLCAFPPFVIIGTVLLDRAFGKLKIMRNLAVIGLCTTALFFYFQPAKNGDIDWSPSIRTDLAVVQYCEQAGLRDRHIFTTSVLRIDFHEPYAGYLSGRPFGNVQSEFTNETEYCIFSGDESGGELLNTIRSNNHLELMRRFTEKYAWREIYRVVR